MRREQGDGRVLTPGRHADVALGTEESVSHGWTDLPFRQASLITLAGLFTADAVVGSAAECNNIETSLAGWADVSQVGHAGYIESLKKQDCASRRLLFSTISALAAWLRTEGLMESSWDGGPCEQAERAICRIATCKGRGRKVRGSPTCVVDG